MPLCCPYDRVCVMVDDDRDVPVAFPVAGLVNTDIYEAVKPSGTLRLNVVQGSVDAPSDRFPVNAHILGNQIYIRGVAGYPLSCQKPRLFQVRKLTVFFKTLIIKP